MESSVRDRNILDEFCIKFCSIVEKHAKYIIVSGFVAISTGRTRGTEDIDLIMERLDKQRYYALHKDLLQAGFLCMQSDNPGVLFDDYLSDNISIRYTLRNKRLPEMEVKFAKDKLDLYQLQHRQKIPLTGLDVWFSSIEMNIAFKEEYLKSDKDMEDAKHFRTVFAEQISEDEIEHIKKIIRKEKL